MKDEEIIKQFKDFKILKFLSQFRDSIIFANEINLRPHMDNRLKLDFFINTLRKRFRKIGKFKFDISEDVEAIMKYYDYNENKAKSVLHLFDEESLNELKRLTYEGGLKNERNIKYDGGGDV